MYIYVCVCIHILTGMEAQGRFQGRQGLGCVAGQDGPAIQLARGL